MSARPVIGALAALLAMVACAQTPYPDLAIQDAAWTSGTHHYAVTQPISSPASDAVPIEISETADAEFVSAAQVRLTPGFHAGAFSGSGQFRARIDQGLGTPADAVLIAPDPATSLVNGVMHVPKWEKVEIGLRLPQEYQDAVDRFFGHYYSHPTDPDIATPALVDAVHDLNPYADDSLQLLLTMVDPLGATRMKWGFYMKEAMWASTSAFAMLMEDFSDPLHPYHIRFRFAPDLEGPWQLTLTLKAPFTTTLSNSVLSQQVATGYSFVCEPPLEDNKGPLSVHEANRRVLKTGTGEPFFGLGTNLNPTPIGSGWSNPSSYQMTRGAFETMAANLALLRGSGGNFIRTWLGNKSFSAEHVNLGVYDRYRDRLSCGGNPIVRGSGQFQAWAFDQMLDLIKQNGMYAQVAVVPFPPIVNYESFAWHNDPYLISFVEPRDPVTNLFDMKRYFYLDGDPANKTTGPLYFWKRYYKYLMSRWGYSVNLAIIEPFQEIDQMLTYYTSDLTDPTETATCPENNLVWPEDTLLPNVVNEWLTDITTFVRSDHDTNVPVTSPLNEDKKLFLISYAGGPGWAHSDQELIDNYYRPFTNPNVDLLDVHLGFNSDVSDQGEPDPHMNGTYLNVAGFRGRFPSLNAPASQRKPFNQGEHTHYTEMEIPGWKSHIENIFHNYDVSFHNEIWTSAFSGKFAAGTSWIWGRVFWAPNPIPPPDDPLNDFQQEDFSNTIPGENELDVGLIDAVVVPNRRLHHHFRPLADLLSHPSWLDLGLFDGDFTANQVFDGSDALVLQSYYLKNAAGNTAIGWVHNRNAWLMNSFYLTSEVQNFLGCVPPNSQSQLLTLPGFDDTQNYYVTWFPTRWDMTDLPPDSEEPLPDTDNDPTTVTLDLSARFGGTTGNYLDTLKSDYAFIITPEPFVKSLRRPVVAEEVPNESVWDFSLYPNPTRDVLNLRMPPEGMKTVQFFDVAGRCTVQQKGVSSGSCSVPLEGLAKGVYWVRVDDGVNTKTKKLILH